MSDTIYNIPDLETELDATIQANDDNIYVEYYNSGSADTVKNKKALFKTLVSEAGGNETATAWSELTTYSTAGVIVERGLRHYAATGKTGNTNKDPLNQINSPYWVCSPGIDRLMEMAINGTVGMEMHPTLDRAGSNYSALMKVDEATIEGTAYEFYRIALDGTTVTGDADYEAALDIGGSNQSAFVDIYAPEVLSVRSVIDMGGRTIRAQSSGGQADTLGEVQADAMQRITGTYNLFAPTAFGGNGALSKGGLGSGTLALATTSAAGYGLNYDNANSTSPNTAKTDDDETRMANIVNGAAYIISMIPA